jgi:HD superfamily phosphohydrolase YqeK
MEISRAVHSRRTSGKSEVMPEVIAGLEIPDTAAVADATRLVQEMTRPFIYHHSRRVFLFSLIHARKLGVKPDPELLYLAAIFHDTGLLAPFSVAVQRFEVDGADHAHKFLLDRGFATAAAETVWTAIALHTTPGIPRRMGPVIATTHLGVLTDAIGYGLDGLEPDQLGEILAVHPRGDFKNEFLRAHVEGLRNRPETTNGTVNSDVLQHFIPGFQRTTMVERVVGSPWPS